jgi:uncharacterized membrane protein YgcG
VAAGKKLSNADRRRVDAAVKAAEAQTGLQFCVYLGRSATATREQAEAAFVEAGLATRPAVLVLVEPDQHRVEIVTAPDARERLTDEECAQALQEMTPYFARNQFVDGLVIGLGELAGRTGPGTADPDAPDLPNVFD